MSDTRTETFQPKNDTKPSTDTDRIIEQYLYLLDRIVEEDEEVSTIVNNNYVRKGEINDDSSRKTST